MKGIKIAMTLHHHPHSPLQKNLWCSSVKVIIILKFFSARSCRHPFWHDSLRRTGLISTVTTITLHPIGGATAITIILHPIGCVIVISGEGGWSGGVSSRRCCGFGVAQDNDVVVTGWPEKPTVEITKKLSGDLLIP
jgi:hypothetical protein